MSSIEEFNAAFDYISSGYLQGIEQQLLINYLRLYAEFTIIEDKLLEINNCCGCVK